MNALDKLYKEYRGTGKKIPPLEWATITLAEGGKDSYDVALEAAEELASIRARLAESEEEENICTRCAGFGYTGPTLGDPDCETCDLCKGTGLRSEKG